MLLAVVDQRHPVQLLDQLGGVGAMAPVRLGHALDDIVDGQFRRAEGHRVGQNRTHDGRRRRADLRTVGHCGLEAQPGAAAVVVVVVVTNAIVVVVVITIAGTNYWH